MKEYGDEGFIALLREGRAEAKKDIRKGKVLADGQVLEFREREIIKRCYGCGFQMALGH